MFFSRFVLWLLFLTLMTVLVQWLTWSTLPLAQHHLAFLGLHQTDFMIFVLKPLGMISIAAICLLIERMLVGPKNSALNLLGQWSDPSVRTDWFCFVVLSLFGLRPILGSIFAMGLTVWLDQWSNRALNLRMIADQSIGVQLIFLFSINPLLFYLVHRLMHARFWEIHRTHHSATSMTILTPHRNHPLDWTIVTLVHTVPAALLGCNFIAIGIYDFINGFYQSLVHSNVSWNSPFIDRYLLISPEAHRLHHSNNPGHFNKNFGILVFWERLFRTHLIPSPSNREFTMGFNDTNLHNSGRPLIEIFTVFKRWLKGI